MDRASQLLNFKFLPFLTFADWKVEEQVRKLCHKAKKKQCISPLAKWLGQLHKQDLTMP
ncbi:putative sET domain protein, partial [Chlamydia psittaci 84-8471/1]